MTTTPITRTPLAAGAITMGPFPFPLTREQEEALSTFVWSGSEQGLTSLIIRDETQVVAHVYLERNAK